MRSGMVSTVGPVSKRYVPSPAGLGSSSSPLRPPGTSSRSRTVTSRPAPTRRRAADSPASPAPTMTTRSVLPGTVRMRRAYGRGPARPLGAAPDGRCAVVTRGTLRAGPRTAESRTVNTPIYLALLVAVAPAAKARLTAYVLRDAVQEPAVAPAPPRGRALPHPSLSPPGPMSPRPPPSSYLLSAGRGGPLPRGRSRR